MLLAMVVMAVLVLLLKANMIVASDNKIPTTTATIPTAPPTLPSQPSPTTSSPATTEEEEATSTTATTSPTETEANTRHCPENCTEQYQPVCGTDGTTYGNKCELQVASCNASVVITEAYEGNCTDAAVNNVTQRSGILSSKMTAEKCAQMCSEYPHCDSFTFDPFQPEESMCSMFSGRVLKPSEGGQISAWCPKGESLASDLLEPSYLRCAVEERQIENRNSNDTSSTEENADNSEQNATTTAPIEESTTTYISNSSGEAKTTTTTATTTTTTTSGTISTTITTTTTLTTTIPPSDEFCQFPFKLRNKTHWDCVEDDNDRGLVCNTNHQKEEVDGAMGSGGGEDEEEEEAMLNFDDTSTFNPC